MNSALKMSEIKMWMYMIVSIHNASDSSQIHFKGVLHPWALFLKTLCIFSKNKATSDKSILWIWSEMFQGTQKSQFYFSRDHCCEVTVKNVRKSIFFMFWAINQ